MPATVAQRVHGLLLAAATAAVFAAWAPGLGPAPAYDSDVAVPLLAAYGEGQGALLLYYPAQDQLGGWPTLIARALTPVVGEWSAHRLHLLLLAIVLSAVFPVARLGGPLAGLAFLASCAWPPSVATNLSFFAPYGAQLATLFWAWWAMRRAADRWSRGWLVVASVFAILSCWSSPTSGPLLALVAGAELLRVYLVRRGTRADQAPLIVGSALGSGASFAIMVAVDHVRLNFYLARYLTPGVLLAGIAAWTGAGLAVSIVMRNAWPTAIEGFALAAAAVALCVPRAHTDVPDQTRAAAQAQALAAAAPGSVLLADYWTTYALAALVRRGELQPLSPEGDVVRFPSVRAALARASTVVVGSEGPLLRPPGSPAAAEQLCQYGVRLVLVRPDLGAPGPQRFALYAPAGSCVR
jgi:hypothetical protein